MTSPQNKFTKPPLSVDDQVNLLRLLKNVAQDSHWIDHFQDLMDNYPSIDLIKMGFPVNWQSLPICS